MFWSRNDFFKQSHEELYERKCNVYALLILKGYSNTEALPYIFAFDYFAQNPTEFDGATIVKDLCDIPGLDLDAMRHDYDYIILGNSLGFLKKWKADIAYLKGMERKGKGVRFGRFFWLTISGIFFVPLRKLKLI